ncbi:arylsulfatase [Planococcus shenhongbingii]|uniref:Arylsulfatase n=1 Tax=Planococcus shenhongbingii TaxID=3058398 RepID=A0ABT8NFT2_9BACL|nr:arylsulfatase [Planococcus sp. N017]MDN7246350.1 arylsulfatase [Planococcus sp. N017]
MTEKKVISRYLNKLSVFSTVAVMASAFTLAGCTSEVSVQPASDEKVKSVSMSTNDTNVIYIVMDDTGFSDFGSYGSEISTPNIDRLADNGLRYNNFHATPVCSPSRASMLTGRNNHAVGMGQVANFDYGEEYPNRRGEIAPEAGTIAEVLGENGYVNYALGKWHVAPTHEITPAGPFHNWPLGKGFHRYYGNLEDSSDQYRPELTRDNSSVPMPEKEDYHYSEDIVEKAQQYVVDQVSMRPDQPFFINLSFGAQHMPHQVPKEYIDAYDGVYDEGWDVIRQQRFEKQKELGVIPKDAKLAPSNPGIIPWDKISEEKKSVYTRFQETYAGFLTHTDEQIGKLLETLEETDELDNTMIVLISDNGASSIGGENGSTNQTIAYNTLTETFEDVEKKADLLGSESVAPDYPAGWAQVSNTPFQKYKNSMYGGGIRTPLIVHWPEKITDKGEVRNQFVHVSDITATVYDVLGISPPKTIKGIKQMPITGISFADTFDDAGAVTKKKTQYFEMSGNRMIYHDGWKAISVHTKGKPFEQDTWELYHAEKDFTELNNIADKQPQKLKQLVNLWEKEAKANNVYPLTDNFLNALGNLPPDNPRARKTFVYHPEMSHLGESATPLILNRSYEISIPVTHSKEDEGVLLALGNDKSGYTFYIQDNKIVYEYNTGVTRYQIVSEQELPEGELAVQFIFEKTAANQGVGNLLINGTEIGEVEMKTLPFKTSFEGLDIGQDLFYPVSPAYAKLGEFPYAGDIGKVTYEFEEASISTLQ